jgi:hypothetical protein
MLAWWNQILTVDCRSRTDNNECRICNQKHNTRQEHVNQPGPEGSNTGEGVWTCTLDPNQGPTKQATDLKQHYFTTQATPLRSEC